MDALLQALSNELRLGISLTTLQDLVSDYNADDWKQHIIYNNTTYNRKLVARTDEADIYIMSWKHGQCSKIHDHPEKGCIMRVMMGTVLETTFGEGVGTADILHYENDVTYKYGGDLHRIRAVTGNAVTMHIYAPPGYIARVFD